jgi:hypothetical protein
MVERVTVSAELDGPDDMEDIAGLAIPISVSVDPTLRLRASGELRSLRTLDRHLSHDGWELLRLTNDRALIETWRMFPELDISVDLELDVTPQAEGLIDDIVGESRRIKFDIRWMCSFLDVIPGYCGVQLLINSRLPEETLLGGVNSLYLHLNRKSPHVDRIAERLSHDLGIELSAAGSGW